MDCMKNKLEQSLVPCGVITRVMRALCVCARPAPYDSPATEPATLYGVGICEHVYEVVFYLRSGVVHIQSFHYYV